MRWLIVEDALRDRKGHWLEYVSTFVRELRALGDEVIVLCDREAQGFVMEQTGARPVLPESIWHRMGDGAGALQRYLRVPGHAIATFFAMRKVLRGFNHEKTRKDTKGEKRGAGSRGLGEKEDLTTDNTDGHGFQKTQQGDAQGACAGASEPDLLTSKLADASVSESPTRDASATPCFGPRRSTLDARHTSARDCENLSLTRSASGPASALDAGRWTLDSGEAPDWIFVPTVLVHHLLGWWMLLRAGSVPGDSRVLLFFPNLPIRLDGVGQPHWTGGPTTKLMAWLFENLRGEVENGKVVLGVETHAMRRALERLIRMPVVYLPHPVPAKPGQGEARGEGRESRGGAGFSAVSQKCGDFLTTDYTDEHGYQNSQQGCAWASQAGVSESDSLASELADSPVSESLTRSASGPALAAKQPKADGGQLRTDEKSGELVHKSSGGEGSGSTRPEGEISCAGAKPELPVCEQGRGGGHDLTTKHTKLHERDEAGQRLEGQAGAAFSNPFTSELARDSENTSPIRCADSPPVALDARPSTLDAEASASPIVFGCYGAARWEKGSDIFQEAIQLILKNEVASGGCRVTNTRNQSVAGAKALDAGRSTLDSIPTAAGRSLRFAIQWVEDFRDRDGNLISIDPWLREHPQVEVIGRYFEGDEYERRLAATDVMVLPYRSPYRLRVSRVVIEAMLNGMPVIATRGTTLFEQAEEYGVVVGCEEGDAESLAEAMLEVAARFEMLRADAKEKVNAAAESFSVEYFRELLKRVGQNH
jgi:glycosyltransferase involved in cell wall biosynthesis